MATNGSSFYQIPDITTCSICIAPFKEPKVLPCIHTFCLHCLDSYCANQNQENELSCPFCKKLFVVPPGGIQDLPNNFFICHLINVNNLYSITGSQESTKQKSCELCSDSETTIPSTSYCIECDCHICDRCSTAHGKIAATQSHKIVHDDNAPCPQKRIKLEENCCKEHEFEPNRLYCHDCKTIMCLKCLSNHSQHKCSDIEEAAEIFRDQLGNDMNGLSTCINKQHTNLEQLEFDAEKFLQKVAATEREISQKCDKLITLVQSHKKELIDQIGQFKDKTLKEVQIKKDEMERQKKIMESFKRYCLEIIDKGTACDISHTGHDLHARAEELVKTQDEPDCCKVSDVEITFKPSLSTLSTTESVKCLIGELILGGKAVTIKEEEICDEDIDLTTFVTNHTLLRFMPSTRQNIAGISALGGFVFLVRCTSEVYIYKSEDFTLKGAFAITGSKQLRAIAAGSHSRYLYASDPELKVVYRYDLKRKTTSNLAVNVVSFGLSITKRNTVLVTLHDTKRIQEYTTDGTLLREMGLDISIHEPTQCFELMSGNYVVCQSGTQNRVCLVDPAGGILQSYGGFPGSGSGAGQLKEAYQLAVDKYDNIMVADNGRVQLLNCTLAYLGSVSIPRFQFKDPYALYYHETLHRLYIGEFNGGRLFALGVS